MQSRDEIAKQAMPLPHADRAYLLDLLERSLPATDFPNDELAEAWSQELDKRVAAYDEGQATAIDFDTSIEQLRQGLAAHQASKTKE